MTPLQIENHVQQTIAILKTAEQMLAIAIAPGNLGELRDDQLDEMWTALQALKSLETPLRMASERQIQREIANDPIERFIREHTQQNDQN